MHPALLGFLIGLPIAVLVLRLLIVVENRHQLRHIERGAEEGPRSVRSNLLNFDRLVKENT